MANPQTENGYIKIANEIAEKLVSFRIPGELYQVLWVILRLTYGWNKKMQKISLSRFIEFTGMQKPNIARALSKMITRKIVIKNDNAKYGFNKNYDEWIPFIGHGVIKKDNGQSLSKRITSVIKNDNEPLSKRITPLPIIKDSIQKTCLKTGAPSAPKNQTLFNEIRNYWNSNAGNPSDPASIPQIVALTPWRVDKLKARLKEHAFVEHWKKAIDKAMSSAFCRGKNDRNWKVDFSWFIENSNNYLKVLEGKYDDKQKTKGKYAHMEDKYE